MNHRELADALPQVTRIAQAASELLMTGWRNAPRIHKKGTIDLVTDFDVKSEELIRAQMTQAFPGVQMVGEESHERPTSGEHWYVDPIDGTTNFAHGHPFFAVSIGLVIDEHPVLGVVSAPALGTLWAAALGQTATRNGKPMRVSATTDLQNALGATGFPYDVATSDENNFAEFRQLQRASRGARRCGAAALDLAMVADGTYDFFWEQKLKPWDVAAGIALVEAAGGKVTTYAGEPFIPATHNQLAATNTKLHLELQTQLARARADR